MSNWQAAEEDDIQDEFDQLELDSAVLAIFYLIFDAIIIIVIISLLRKMPFCL
jgi:hypothetical protein